MPSLGATKALPLPQRERRQTTEIHLRLNRVQAQLQVGGLDKDDEIKQGDASLRVSPQDPFPDSTPGALAATFILSSSS